MHKTLAATIAILLASTPSLGADGGGTVLNVLDVPVLTGTLASANDTVSHPETWTISVTDENGLSDIESVTLNASNENAQDVWTTTITPVGGAWVDGNGWTVLGTGPDSLDLEYSRTWTTSDYASGSQWIITVTVEDIGGLSTSEDDATSFALTSVVDIASGIWGSDCGSLVTPWTGWTAAPNATNVFEQAWIRVVNTGSADGQVSVAWQEDVFAKAAEEVPIDGNIRYVTATTSQSQCPGDVTPVTGPLDADGSAVIDVPAGQRVWLSYELASLPTPLSAGQYLASYTVQVI